MKKKSNTCFIESLACNGIELGKLVNKCMFLADAGNG